MKIRTETKDRMEWFDGVKIEDEWMEDDVG